MRFGAILTFSVLAVVVASVQAESFTGNGPSSHPDKSAATTAAAAHLNKPVDVNSFRKVVDPAKVATALKTAKRNKLSFAKRGLDENERNENERDENERDENERDENERDENERDENERDENERDEN